MRSCQLNFQFVRLRQRSTLAFGTWIIQKTNYPLIQPTDLYNRLFLVPFRMDQAQAPSYSPDMQSGPTYPAVIIKWLVPRHSLESFVVHFKLAFLLICLISVALWDSSTTNNGWTRCVCVLHKRAAHKGTPFSRWRTRKTKGRTIEQEDWHFWCKMYHEIAEKVIFNQ